MANFTGQPISESYPRVLQLDGGIIQDGLGNTIDNATIGSLSGSFSGSFQGNGSQLTGIFPFTGSAEITGSLVVTGSINGLNLGLGAGSISTNIAIG